MKNSEGKELSVDENWKINTINMSNIIPSDNSNLKEYFRKFFHTKNIDSG